MPLMNASNNSRLIPSFSSFENIATPLVGGPGMTSLLDAYMLVPLNIAQTTQDRHLSCPFFGSSAAPLVGAEGADGTLVLVVSDSPHSRHPAELLHMRASRPAHGLPRRLVMHQPPRQLRGRCIVVRRIQVPCTAHVQRSGLNLLANFIFRGLWDQPHAHLVSWQSFTFLQHLT